LCVAGRRENGGEGAGGVQGGGDTGPVGRCCGSRFAVHAPKITLSGRPLDKLTAPLTHRFFHSTRFNNIFDAREHGVELLLRRRPRQSFCSCRSITQEMLSPTLNSNFILNHKSYPTSLNPTLPDVTLKATGIQAGF